MGTRPFEALLAAAALVRVGRQHERARVVESGAPFFMTLLSVLDAPFSMKH